MVLPTAVLDGRARNGNVSEIDLATRPRRRRRGWAEDKAEVLAEYR
ncbi:MAG: hypothetical protein ACYCV5_02700 [Acidimicrobiales bacterium]